MATILYPFTTAGNYTLSSASKLEVDGGYLQLKEITPTDSVTGATYTTAVDLSFGSSTLTGTAVLNATITANRLNLSFADGSYVTYPAANIASIGNTFSFRCKYTPNYNNTSTNNCLLSLVENGTTNNLVTIRHKLDEKLGFIVGNAAGGQIANQSTAWVGYALGTTYEILFCSDSTTGLHQIYIDGVQLGGDDTGTGTRTNAALDEFYIGTLTNFSDQPEYFMEDMVIYDSIVTTSNYTPGYTLPETMYATDDPTALFLGTFKSSDFLTFVQDPTAVGTDITKYTITIDGTETYWDGAVWGASNGTYAEANTAAEIHTNAASLIGGTRSTIQIKAFMHSDDGSTRIKLDLLTITYNSVLADPTFSAVSNAPSELEGFAYSPDGALASEIVRIRPFVDGFVNEEVFHPYKWKTVATTDSNGWFSTPIYVPPSTKYWELKIGPQRYKIDIEDIATNNLKDIIIQVLGD